MITQLCLIPVGLAVITLKLKAGRSVLLLSFPFLHKFVRNVSFRPALRLRPAHRALSACCVGWRRCRDSRWWRQWTDVTVSWCRSTQTYFHSGHHQRLAVSIYPGAMPGCSGRVWRDESGRIPLSASASALECVCSCMYGEVRRCGCAGGTHSYLCGFPLQRSENSFASDVVKCSRSATTTDRLMETAWRQAATSHARCSCGRVCFIL